MIKKIIAVITAICASAMLLSSCGDDDDGDDKTKNNPSVANNKTTWAELVEENSWLSVFPEFSNEIDNDLAFNTGVSSQVSITVLGADETTLKDYMNKLETTSGFERIMDEAPYAFEKEEDDVTYMVQGSFISSMGVQTVTIPFSKMSF